MSGPTPKAVRSRRSRRRRSRPVLSAFVVMCLLGLCAVLLDHYGPPRADSGDPPPWTIALSYVAAEPTTAAPGPTPFIPTAPVPLPPATTVTALDTPFPRSGPQTFTFVETAGDVLGTSGPIRLFHVALESNIAVLTPDDFAAKVNATLGDARSWVAGRTYRLQMVPATIPADFTIYLVTASTSVHMCAPLATNGYTSCRQGPRVVLNLDRWMTSVPDYVRANIALSVYQTYMINHEVGHALGHSHERCPAPGRLAPVMQQQTLGLRGCVANPWPYLNGKRYDGPPGSY